MRGGTTRARAFCLAGVEKTRNGRHAGEYALIQARSTSKATVNRSPAENGLVP